MILVAYFVIPKKSIIFAQSKSSSRKMWFNCKSSSRKMWFNYKSSSRKM